MALGQFEQRAGQALADAALAHRVEATETASQIAHQLRVDSLVDFGKLVRDAQRLVPIPDGGGEGASAVLVTM